MEGKHLLIGLLYITLMVSILVSLSACYKQPASEPETNMSDLICIPKENLTEKPTEPTNYSEKPSQPEEYPGIPKKVFVEGDLVSLSVKATDADEDRITIRYSKPLNSKGEWQTKVGDAGKYLVTITASDGKAETTKQVLIIVEPQNHPPVMEKINEVVVSEGDTINFLPVVNDIDKDQITITYSGWMNGPTKTTKFGEAGNYKVTITASDGKAQVSQTVDVKVIKGNRAPVIDDIEPINVTEGETVIIVPNALDPDGDKIKFIYSEPLDSKGRWVTKEGDAGTYLATVTVTDGKLNASTTVSILVNSLNNPPKIVQDDVVVNVGDVVKLSPKVIDKDGDDVTVTYSGWMESSTKATTADDAGVHIVTITATDGKATSTLNIRVTVNTPPEFIFE
ncbi:MAG: hypothetical protein QXK37_06200 [Candidatus Woesearchaeota archaeon]